MMHNPNRAATLNALRDLRTLLATPERWTRRPAARDALGCPVVWNDPLASCWALPFAAARIAQSLEEWHRLYGALMPHVNGAVTLFAWNSALDRTHADVLALIDAAIERECLAVVA